MNTTVVQVEQIAAIDHDNWMGLAETEYGRVLALLNTLSADDWLAPTVCTPWSVRDIVGHLIGMMKRFADPVEAKRQDEAAAARAASGENWLDALTDNQVHDHEDLDPNELLAMFRDVAPRALAARRDSSAELRAAPFQAAIPGEPPWTLGYLFDVIHTRDPWMHRVDIATATGHPIALTGEHDGRIVADVVAEWARRHGEPFHLRLDGPAGGTFASGVGGSELRYDAVEFCQTLSGRGTGSGLLTTPVPF